MISITLQYIEGCPNWKPIAQELTALIAGGTHATIGLEEIDSYDTAVEKGFVGSPTVLIDGVDPFAGENDQPTLACRMYSSKAGLAGRPSIDQLRAAIEIAAEQHKGACPG